MAKVKVWNDNVYPFTQEFKGDMITVAPKGYVMMDYEDAIEFKSMFSPMKKLADDQPDPRFFKMIRVEQPGMTTIDEKTLSLRCHADGSVAASAEELEAKLKENAHLVVKDEELDAEIAKRRGRPRKDESPRA